MSLLCCGFAQRVITPAPYEAYLDGYGFRVSPAEGTRDDLYVKVCALSCGQERFAIAAFDICGFRTEIAREVKEHIAALSGIAPEKIALCATHTHAGPSARLLGDLPVNEMYWHHVGEAAGRAVAEALASATPGSFDYAFGERLQSTHNRRGGELNDQSVRAAAFFDRDGKIKGVLARAACHAVIRTDMLYSADFPGVLTREAATKYPGVPMLYLQGGGADINPYFEGNPSEDEKSERLGGELARSVFGILKGLGGKREQTGMKSAFAMEEIPMKPYPKEEELKEEIRRLGRRYYEEEHPVKKRVALRSLNWHRMILRRVRAGEKSALFAPLQAMELIGGMVFVLLPFEVLTRTARTIEQMLIKRGHAPESIFVLGYANDNFLYLAPEAELERGGYEFADAPMWGDVPMCSRRSEPAVLSAVEKLIDSLD